MNSLLLLLGLLGLGAAGSSSRGSEQTTSSGRVPDSNVSDDDTNDDAGTADDADDGEGVNAGGQDDAGTADDADDGEGVNAGGQTDDTDTDDNTTSDDGADTTDNEEEVPAAAAAITLVIYDAQGGIVEEIANGDSIDFGDTDVSDYRIGAIIDGERFSSVLFTVDGETYTQNVAPYDIRSDALDLSNGDFDITVTVHSGFSGAGDLLATETFSFETTALDTAPVDDGSMDHGSDDGSMDHGTDDGSMDHGTDDGSMDHGSDDGSMDHGTDDGSMDHGSDDHDIDHGTPSITPPGVGASDAEITAFLKDLADAPETHSHGSGSMANEHMTAMDLAPRGDATHVAIGDGDWDDPNIWSNGEVPGDNAKVLIPDGVTVNYDTVSDARLFTVRIDGALDFATDTDSQMIFDTMIVSPTGHLIIGTENDPVNPDVNVDLIVANNGKIDTDWDPMLLSRGIIAHGETKIHGAEKDSHDKVVEDPMKGDTSVKMAGGVPEGWAVGDKIVIAGTHYEGWSGNRENWIPPEDEERIITKIDSDGTIHFEEPLVHDHDSPRDDLKTSVANYTRNVSVETENGADAEVFERGHVMFMHSDDVDVRYAEFTELGRTDKSFDSHNVEDINNISFDSNIQGRYSLHIHRAGTEDLDNPAILEGNAVYGSPGWGVVHHDSNALITNNATYDTFGAGFIAETGNETGLWDDNIVIFAQGQKWGIPKNTADTGDLFDIARGGEGFWFQGRMVVATNNVAASVNTGFAYHHREFEKDDMIDFDSELFDYSGALYYEDVVTADDVPILGFEGNETFAAREGLHVVKASPKQGHDVWSHLKDFTAWSVVSGAHMQYTSHYILEDFDLVGKETEGFHPADSGIEFGNNTTEMVVINAKIDGFDIGMDLHKSFTDPDEYPRSYHEYKVIDAEITNVNKEFVDYEPEHDVITSSNNLPYAAPDLDLGKLTYQEGTYDQRVVWLDGTKTDSLGETRFPGGMDEFRLRRDDVVEYLQRDGYFSTSDGDRYFLLDVYFTDRLTADVYYETHAVYLDDNVPLDNNNYSGAKYNGEQDIVTRNGVEMAGDTILDKAFLATPDGGFAVANGFESSLDLADALVNEDLDPLSLAEGDVAQTMAMITVDDGNLFANAGDMEDIMLAVDGGDAVLAIDGGRYEVSDDRTLAIAGSDSRVGFDGEDGGIAILDLKDDATVAFIPDAGGFSAISEFHSGALESDEPNVQSGIDLGMSTLELNLSDLSADDGSSFLLMEADEIVGMFGEASIGGLGERDAKLIVDYENDSVSLQLSSGTGALSVEAVGAQTDVTSGSEELWAALTADQPVLNEAEINVIDEVEDVQMVA